MSTLRNAGHRTLAPPTPTVTLVLAALLVAAALALMFVIADSGGGGGEEAGGARSVEATSSTLPAARNQRIQEAGVNGPGAHP
jgi:hypothetical protein